MTLEETLKGGSLKALSSIRGMKDVEDAQVIAFYNEIEYRYESHETWKMVMCNLHKAKPEDLDEMLELDSGSVVFYKFVKNTVMRELNHAEVEFKDLWKFYPGAGRSIMAISWMLEDNTIRADQAKALLKEVLKPERANVDIESIICYTDILDEDTSAMDDVIREVLAANPQVVAEYKSGKEKVLGSLIGQVMKKMKGNPQEITTKLKALI